MKVLDGLLEEDDKVVETWYLLNKLRATFDARVNSSQEDLEVGSKIWLKPSNDEGDIDADGYNGNASYYLK